jgi:type III restriction enzyme
VNRHVGAVAGRLSLRAPQRESLEILARVAELLPLRKDQDVAAALAAIQAAFPAAKVEDFEREFPSLCFAIATGVGKTRLMGACIAYLHLAHGIRHFFVLAPNLTIYDKLIADFTPNTPKYVFQGIAEFAVDPPAIITGDNYESGVGVRDEAQRALLGERRVHVNVFNISKINTEVKGGRAPRIKRLSEYIGQSYFEYLAGLPDLVLLMDESHRYRASAGVRAINELRPVLGLEFTATPQIESARGPVPFKNVIYSYPLANAMADGFVKEPAVATRENFDASSYSEDQLERLKLEDGIHLHESTKVELDVYARQTGLSVVKPFVLVVAQDTEHASKLKSILESDGFFEGRYRGRVAEVHSRLRGEENDENVQKLLSVESAEEPTEVVVHVNMLKEGWDVTNLYTIVPLRAASSRTLVEQSIGRGLRLPYGRRTGVDAIDRLTIVAHDRFQEIIDHANDPNSIIRRGVVIGRDVPAGGRKAIVAVPEIERRIEGLPSPTERAIGALVLRKIGELEGLPSSRSLSSPDVRAQLVHDVTAAWTPPQGALPGVEVGPEIGRVVDHMIEEWGSLTFDIPRVVVVPKGDVTPGYEDFELDPRSVALQPVPDNILIEHLRTHARERLSSGTGVAHENRLEDYIVSALIDYDDINYDAHAELLYKLAGQMVARLGSYLPDEDAVRNVLQYHQEQLARLIHAQMEAHRREAKSDYDARVTRGFTTLRPAGFTADKDEEIRDFRPPLADPQRIRSMVFSGFRKCLYGMQRFQSDPERRFAMSLEDDPDVLKWFKPAPGHIRIYGPGEITHDPDFAVETKTEKLLCEIKRASEMADPAVLAKADAAALWCEAATRHEMEHGGKPWRYLMIPHDAIDASRTLAGFRASYSYRRSR